METATESTRPVVMILFHLKKKNVDPNASGSYRPTHNLLQQMQARSFELKLKRFLSKSL